MRGPTQPLEVVVEGGELTIRIGVSTLAFSAERMVANNPYNELTGGFAMKYVVRQPVDFAKDVCRQLGVEASDGSTPLERLLDEMMEEAICQGSNAVEEAKCT